MFSVSSMVAQAHVVSPAELQKATVAATQARQGTSRLSSSSVILKLQGRPECVSHGRGEVTQAVSQLNDQELAQLAARASKAQADFAAGTLSDRDLIIILLRSPH